MADLTIEERVSQLESDFLYFKAAGQTQLQNSASACQEAAASAKITADAAGEALSTIKSVTTDTYAKDVEVVHNSGNEDIAGIKSFTNATRYVLPMVKGTPPSANVSNGFNFLDSNRVNMGYLNMTVKADGSSWLYLAISKSIASQEIASGITLTTTANADEISIMAVAANLIPSTDHTYSLGTATVPWPNIFCSSGTINTSDERLKMEIAEYPDELLDAWGDVAYRQFIFKDAYQKKGDDARTHTGLITQQIEAAFKAHGVDPEKYGLFCYDKWDSTPEIKDRDGNIIQQAQEAGEKYGLRYTECLCVEAAYQRRRADRLEARLAKLEAIVENLASQE